MKIIRIIWGKSSYFEYIDCYLWCKFLALIWQESSFFYHWYDFNTLRFNTMRILPLILTVLLTAAWAYTSWYWYTCNIKWFCSNDRSYQETTAWDIQELDSLESIESSWSFENTQELQDDVLITWSWDNIDSPRLSAEDVLFDPLPKEIESSDDEPTTNEEEESQGETDLVETDASGTGTSVDIVNTDEIAQEWDTREEDVDELSDSQENINICDTPLVGPIGLGRENLSQEVQALELFLISRGDQVEIDGIYGEDDFEAIKRFQLEYKEDVLDPWGIENPTGYVGRTSISKINEIACK